MITTLNKIRAFKPCEDGWHKLLKHLSKTKADDEPLSIATILDSNGLSDALWCLKAVDGYDREIRLFAVWCARQVQHLMTDPRSIAALDVAERYAFGQATDDDLRKARGAATDAAWASAWASAGVARAAAWAAAGGAVWGAVWAARAAGAAAADAGNAAWAAARAAGDAARAARAAARDAAGDAAGTSAWVAWDAAREAVGTARGAARAAWDAARDAAGAAARTAQAEKLREVCMEIEMSKENELA